VSLAQLGRTRAPLYSALLPLPAVACGGPATKAFLVFDTVNCTHLPTLPDRPFTYSRLLSLSLSLPTASFPFFFLTSFRRTNRESLRGKKKEKETKGWLCKTRKVAAAIRSHCRVSVQ